MMKKHFFLLFFALTTIVKLYATHNRAGEITYEHIAGLTYRITLTTYTESTSTAYRCEQEIDFGDGKKELVTRVNGPLGSRCGATGAFDSSIPSGVNIGNGVIKNVYVTTHTYAGSGSYFISLTDPDRNDGICNVPDKTPFFIRTELTISPFLGVNNSPILLNPPIDQACVGECFEHNPAAFDPDGDSLVYTLVASTRGNNSSIVGYFFPPGMSVNDLDPIKGDLEWCVPTVKCEYNIAILIKEYRRLPGSSQRYYIGSVLRDMQITVDNNCNNIPPQITPLNDTCVLAGSNINFGVSATDLNNNIVTLSASGSPFEVSNKATFSSTPLPKTVTGVFNWNPTCAEVQALPYLITFKAKDNHPRNPLADFETIFIQVVAPPPTALAATPIGTGIELNWNPTLCNSTSGVNPLLSYDVYRKEGCAPWVHDDCQTGVPTSAGFKLVGQSEPSITTFVDDNNGKGLNYGVEYSYVVVANYLDGAQSYASNSVCEKLRRDVPIITNVSVLSTGETDSIWVRWIPPLGDSANLDTTTFAPNYEVKILQAQGLNPLSNSFTEIGTYVYDAFWKIKDTTITSVGINTSDFGFTYRIDFFASGILIGSSNTASSVYLSSSPTDNQVDLTWEKNVPWNNYKYFIYRETFPSSGVFDLIDSTTQNNYSDKGLINLQSYCYKIRSEGAFSDTSIIAPLFNESQVKCETPVDIIPPCQPEILVLNNDCDKVVNSITWRNPDSYCSDDVKTYKVYFSPTDVGELSLIQTIDNEFDTTFLHTYLVDNITPSVAGCYAIVAIDSTGNESLIVSKKCVDNCDLYELPNVFTPNGDGQNDLFIPITPYKFIRDVDIKIYDRWGTLMFETTDRNINWDGKNKKNQKMCSDGVYFYVCTVNQIRLSGIVPVVKKGFFNLINDTGINIQAK